MTSFSIPARKDWPGFLLAHFGKEGVPETVIPKMSQAMLAEMIGTTRSRVSFFMNRFRKLGFIDYHAGDELQVHSSLLNIVHSLTHERSQDRDLSTEATRSGDLRQYSEIRINKSRGRLYVQQAP